MSRQIRISSCIAATSAFIQTGCSYLKSTASFAINNPVVGIPAAGVGVGVMTHISPNYPQEKIGDVFTAAMTYLTSFGIDGVIAFGNRIIIPVIQTGVDRSIDFANSIAKDPTKISKPIYGEGAPKNMVGLDVFAYQIIAAHPIATTSLALGTISYIAYEKFKDDEKINKTLNKISSSINNILAKQFKKINFRQTTRSLFFK